MCGRYASTKAAVDIAEEFHAVDATGDAAPGPDYNVAPTKPVLTVVQRHPRGAEGGVDEARTERSVRVLRWGLVPSWAKDPSGGSRMINARAETAADKPSFRAALAARRCLLPADGWYEWRRGSGAKQPFFITGATAPARGGSLAMAGIWEFWRSPAGGEPLVTAAVLTTDAVGPLAEIHPRMPLLLAAEDWAAWLDPDGEPPASLLRPPSEALVAGLELRPVSAMVNNVRNEGPELVARAEPAEPELPLELPTEPTATAAEPTELAERTLAAGRSGAGR
ncbi:MAG TPA: SOS response-associated peptidase [Pseudonocardia sp.]|jgi:putative SOS response-associated peptidase YedK|uniref:SOS response-associated peptidase n=1 Tax=Pseudonocardia sp. TaxID=60912 RepID=UPI002ED89753